MRANRRVVHVNAISASSVSGLLRLGHLRFPCSLGRGGRTFFKREGDGATPRGRHRLRLMLHRGRRGPWPVPAIAIRTDMGWCDAPEDPNYNRPVPLPYSASHEDLWRADRLYDVVGVLDWNERPRVRGRGSAIFLHLRRSDCAPTAGCLAISAEDMRRLLPLLRRRTIFAV